jgi:hypothetical protein
VLAPEKKAVPKKAHEPKPRKNDKVADDVADDAPAFEMPADFQHDDEAHEEHEETPAEPATETVAETADPA